MSRSDDRSGRPGSTSLERLDVAVGEKVARHRDDALVKALGAASELADQPPLLTLCGAVLAFGAVAGDARAARAGAGMMVSVLIATGVKAALKTLVSRTRPHLLLDRGEYELALLGPGGKNHHSFPSGHAAGSVAAARAVARVYPQARLPAYASAAVISAVQVPRAAHYPLDVIAGVAIGLAAEAAAHRLIGAGLRARHPPPGARTRPPAAPREES